MKPMKKTTEQLVHILRAVADRIEDGDSYQGHFSWDCMDETCGKDEFLVLATFRVGNKEGQGQVVLMGEMEESP